MLTFYSSDSSDPVTLLFFLLWFSCFCCDYYVIIILLMSQIGPSVQGHLRLGKRQFLTHDLWLSRPTRYQLRHTRADSQVCDISRHFWNFSKIFKSYIWAENFQICRRVMPDFFGQKDLKKKKKKKKRGKNRDLTGWLTDDWTWHYTTILNSMYTVLLSCLPRLLPVV